MFVCLCFRQIMPNLTVPHENYIYTEGGYTGMTLVFLKVSKRFSEEATGETSYIVPENLL